MADVAAHDGGQSPGALHHIIVRGIEKRKIFKDPADRRRFIERLSSILSDSQTHCYAYFNRRHRRRGHLFQNCYKSILCQEDSYLLELVRYIHLNPLRAKQVSDLKKLARYPYCGI